MVSAIAAHVSVLDGEKVAADDGIEFTLDGRSLPERGAEVGCSDRLWGGGHGAKAICLAAILSFFSVRSWDWLRPNRRFRRFYGSAIIRAQT